MPLNIEDTLIRVLVDTQKGVQDVKKMNTELTKTGKAAAMSGKDLLRMAGAFGGVSSAIDIGIKAIASYVQKVKESEQAYIDAVKQVGIWYDDSVAAIVELDEVKAQAQIEDGKRHTERMQWWRELRTESIKQKKVLGELNNYLIGQYYEQKDALDAAGISMEEFLRTERAALTEGTDTFTDTWLQVANDLEDVAARSKIVAKDFSELSTQEAAADKARQEAFNLERAEMAERQRLITERLELEGHVLTTINDLRNDLHQQEMDRIAEETEARKQSAIDSLNNWSSFVGAVGSLVSNMYQAEADAAERGSKAQEEALTKQFKAEKAMGVTQSLIATAVGITKAIPNIPLMIFAGVQGLIQTAAILATKPPNFSAATGTSPSGYTVPSGYENDNFPVMAKTGEKVHVERAGNDSGQIVNNNLYIDGYMFGQVITRLTKSGKATIAKRAVVA